MAAIQLRAVRDVGGIATASKTMSDANFTRVVTQHMALLGLESADSVLMYFLERIIKQMVGTTKSNEKANIGVPDIPVT